MTVWEKREPEQWASLLATFPVIEGISCRQQGEPGTQRGKMIISPRVTRGTQDRRQVKRVWPTDSRWNVMECDGTSQKTHFRFPLVPLPVIKRDCYQSLLAESPWWDHYVILDHATVYPDASPLQTVGLQKEFLGYTFGRGCGKP